MPVRELCLTELWPVVYLSTRLTSEKYRIDPVKDIPDDLIIRYNKAEHEWKAVQNELLDLYGRPNDKYDLNEE